ncbi:ABC transporter permease [Terrihabitans rhizophilus]|uniref:ABC transporter permease n=1 Tax=Terrihabitans rhizophilus TaxID=3092662 RepID=A0ABU4RQ52_9HYPH|nr:ABC transporter permease [Terrihabitans sp. PJ23]MDX6806962.1 ABC transporter permease [Terrihabitans sp. PJ23]
MRPDLSTAGYSGLGWRGFVLPAAILGLWSCSSALGLGNEHILVSPLRVLSAAAEAVMDENGITALLHSLGRFISGWLIGSAAGLAAGLAMGLSPTADRAGGPTFHALRQVALFAWLPLLSAWFGMYDAPKIVLISMAAFFPAALNTQAGCRGVPKTYREVGRVLELGPASTVWRVILPAAAPSIIAGLQLGLIASWIGTVGSEYLIGNGQGIGILLSAAREGNRMDLVIVCIVTLAFVGLFFSQVVRLGSRRLIARHLPS